MTIIGRSALFATVAILASAVAMVSVPAPAGAASLLSAPHTEIDTGWKRVTLVSANDLRLEISTVCNEDHAIFRIRNAGAAFPQTGKFSVYGIGEDGRRVVSSRRMRLAEGQRASFRVKRGTAGNLGLFVEPSWYARDFAYDATMTCP